MQNKEISLSVHRVLFLWLCVSEISLWLVLGRVYCRGKKVSPCTATPTLLLLRWRYSPGWALASFTICLQASRSPALSLHSYIPIFLRSVDTSSNHLIFGLPLCLVAYSFPYNIFFGIAVSCILSIWPSRRILWPLMNLTMFSLLIIASNSSFRRILHNFFSFTVPQLYYITFI